MYDCCIPLPQAKLIFPVLPLGFFRCFSQLAKMVSNLGYLLCVYQSFSEPTNVRHQQRQCSCLAGRQPAADQVYLVHGGGSAPVLPGQETEQGRWCPSVTWLTPGVYLAHDSGSAPLLPEQKTEQGRWCQCVAWFTPGVYLARGSGLAPVLPGQETEQGRWCPCVTW